MSGGGSVDKGYGVEISRRGRAVSGERPGRVLWRGGDWDCREVARGQPADLEVENTKDGGEGVWRFYFAC